MAVRIMLGTPGREDVVLTLTPGHWERALLGAPGEYTYPPHVSILLIEDDEHGDVNPGYKHIPAEQPAHTEQGALL